MATGTGRATTVESLGVNSVVVILLLGVLAGATWPLLGVRFNCGNWSSSCSVAMLLSGAVAKLLERSVSESLETRASACRCTCPCR